MVKKEAERGKGDLRSPKERKLAIKFVVFFLLGKCLKVPRAYENLYLALNLWTTL